MLSKESKNPLSGVNQQERLLQTEQFASFLAGFIEGEGSVTVSVKEHPNYKFGYYLQPEFFLYQHVSGLRILEMAQKFFDYGRIKPKHGNEIVMVYSIMSRDILRDRVVPFFDKYVLPFSCKAETFLCFKEIIERLDKKEHSTAEGMINIVRLLYKMNPNAKGKKRKRTFHEVCERILRGHTSDT